MIRCFYKPVQPRKPPVAQKLTAEQVRLIRALLANGRSQSDVARDYGVTKSTIADIRHGRTWVRLLREA